MKPVPSVEAALAQLAKEDSQPKLRVQFKEGNEVTPPGVKLSKFATSTTPALFLSTSLIKPHPGDKYLAVCLDLDAPFPSFSFLGPIAHWIELDLVAVGSDVEGFTPIETKNPSVIPYAGPGPPPPSAPHRYVFLVWEQPENITTETGRKALSLPETPGVTSRMRWDQPAFEKALGLGEPLAVNYFTASSE